MNATGRPTPRAARRRHLAGVVVWAVALTACAQDDQADGVAADDPTAEDQAAEEDAALGADDAPDGDAAMIATGSTDLGDVLVDADGMTLYLFDPDDQGPSTCYDGCVDNWPPLLTNADPSAGDGVDDTLLGTTERDDGTTQVTYDDWPLYRWAADQAPGDTTGQAVQDVWWVLDPNGTPIRETAGTGNGSGNRAAY